MTDEPASGVDRLLQDVIENQTWVALGDIHWARRTIDAAGFDAEHNDGAWIASEGPVELVDLARRAIEAGTRDSYVSAAAFLVAAIETIDRHVAYGYAYEEEDS